MESIALTSKVYQLLNAGFELIYFGAWLNENGWQPYGSWDMWINTSHNCEVKEVTELFEEYEKTKP